MKSPKFHWFFLERKIKMKINKLFFGGVLIFLILINSIYSQNVQLEEKCVSPCIKVISYDNKNLGSAVIVKSFLMKDEKYSNIALSCNHVTSGKNIVVEVCGQKCKRYFATAIFEHEKNDLSVIQFVSDDKQKTAEIDLNSKLFIGDDLISVGFGLSQTPKVGWGKITTNSQTEDSFKGNYFTNIPLVMGDSGGPIYKNNKLIALSQAIRVLNWKDNLLPVPSVSVIVPLFKIVELNKQQDNKLDFVLNQEKSPPMYPHLILQMQDFDGITIKK